MLSATTTSMAWLCLSLSNFQPLLLSLMTARLTARRMAASG